MIPVTMVGNLRTCDHGQMKTLLIVVLIGLLGLISGSSANSGSVGEETIREYPTSAWAQKAFEINPRIITAIDLASKEILALNLHPEDFDTVNVIITENSYIIGFFPYMPSRIPQGKKAKNVIPHEVQIDKKTLRVLLVKVSE
jgi:hypothetical protein